MAWVIPLRPMTATSTETKLMLTTSIKSLTETLKFLNMEMTFNTLEVHSIAWPVDIDEFDEWTTM
jgi:hypothetical protein